MAMLNSQRVNQTELSGGFPSTQVLQRFVAMACMEALRMPCLFLLFVKEWLEGSGGNLAEIIINRCIHILYIY